MVSPYNLYNFYLILKLITTCAADATDITAARGSCVCLPCASDLYNNSTVVVTWRKNGHPGILCQYHVDNGTATDIITCNHHINQTTKPPTLCISGVKTRDAGYYNCSLARSIPPPSLERSYKVKLHIEGPPRFIIESKTSNKSDCLWLLCELVGLDSPEVNLTWSRNGQSISETTSPLHLCNHDWSEGDIFTCNMSQSSNYTDLSASITITKTHSREVPHDSKYPLIIICGGALTGSLVLICLVICIYKCKPAKSSDADIMYKNNEVYESATGQQTQRNVTTQQEPCIYEN